TLALCVLLLGRRVVGHFVRTLVTHLITRVNETSEDRTMGPIILCHAFEDKKVVGRVYDALREAGFEVWIDPESVFGEFAWESDTDNCLRQAACMLVFLSKNSVRKIGSTHHEFGQLIDTWKDMPDGTIHTIPVRINDCQMPELLSRLDHIDLFEDEGLEHVIRCLHENGSKWQASAHFSDAQTSDQALGTEVQDDALGGFHAAVDSRGEVVDVPTPLSDQPMGSKVMSDSATYPMEPASGTDDSPNR
ncbi:toll/interleukin-1 receptor domain-containing protein, partial [Candidatus Entotheonella palauensis]|uniref:toll/interleukin-1 receptor domain-containing protein n=1 Tax=Candidatus Entotheonella palauensis TaxID=93172 RepID=UPI001C4DEDE4